MELSQEQLEKIFELSGINCPNKVTKIDVTKALIEIERKLNFFPSTTYVEKKLNFKVLIIDDLELSLYQLNKMLNKIDIYPKVARNAKEALDYYKKNDYDYIFTDIFLPDANDGLNLIKSLNKIKMENNRNTQIVAISSSDDQENISCAIEYGAIKFIIKDKKWHNEILLYITEDFNKNGLQNFSKTNIKNNFIIYDVYNLSNIKAVHYLTQDINLSVLNGANKIYVDLSKIRIFDRENISEFAHTYRNCLTSNCEFALIKPANIFLEALKYAYLTDIIPIKNEFNR